MDTSEDGILGKINDSIREQNFKAAIRYYGDLIDQKMETRTPAVDYQNRGALYIAVRSFENAAADFSKALSRADWTKSKPKKCTTTTLTPSSKTSKSNRPSPT